MPTIITDRIPNPQSHEAFYFFERIRMDYLKFPVDPPELYLDSLELAKKFSELFHVQVRPAKELPPFKVGDTIFFVELLSKGYRVFEVSNCNSRRC